MMTRLLRTALVTSLFVALAAPAWPGCTGQAPASGSGSSGGGGGQDSSGGDRGSGGSWDNGAAEREQQGAAAAAAGDLQGGGYAGAREGAAAGGAVDYTSQINALAGEQAAQDAANAASQANPPGPCDSIRAQLADVTRDLLTSNRDQQVATSDLSDKQRQLQNVKDTAPDHVWNPAELNKMLVAATALLKSPDPDVRRHAAAMVAWLGEVRLLGKSDGWAIIDYWEATVVEAQAKLYQLQAIGATLQSELQLLQGKLASCQAARGTAISSGAP